MDFAIEKIPDLKETNGRCIGPVEDGDIQFPSGVTLCHVKSETISKGILSYWIKNKLGRIYYLRIPPSLTNQTPPFNNQLS
jgi:hypothetical protein